MFKRLFMALVACITLSIGTAQAQNSLAMGIATGVPVGTYGATGAAIHTMLMDDASQPEVPMSKEEARSFYMLIMMLCGVMLVGLAALMFTMEPVWTSWLVVIMGLGFVIW